MNNNLVEKSNMPPTSQFICEICGKGYEQKSRLDRHLLTSHPKPALSIADVEKILSNITFPKSKKEILGFVNSRQNAETTDNLLALVKNLPNLKYRDSAEVAKALGEMKSGKKIRSAEDVESSLSPSKKGGNIAAKYSISAATLARALSGINLPQSKENINKYLKKNISKMNKDLQTDILKIYSKLPRKKYKDMTDIEKELSQIQ
ncbi:MAG: C2H2-type zinc finger protein [Nitrososphaeraceae archaeon]